MACNVEHIPSQVQRMRVRDLVSAGIPKRDIARIIGISENTLNKHYRRELESSEQEMIEAVSKVAVQKALDGNEKMLAYVLSRKGNKYGWVDKQVIEASTDPSQLKELKDKIEQLEHEHEKDY